MPEEMPAPEELDFLSTPTHIMVLTWDADTGMPKLVIGPGINVFEARALLEAAIDDLWEDRPVVRILWDGLDEENDEDDEDDEDDEGDEASQ